MYAALTLKLMFKVKDFLDIEIIPAIAYILGCSRATAYRTIKRAKVPVYYIPNKTSQTLLHAASLWRLAVTPAFNRYYKRQSVQTEKGLCQTVNIKDITELVHTGLLPLSLPEAAAALNAGLIPLDRDGSIAGWFKLYLEDKLVFPLPRKC